MNGTPIKMIKARPGNFFNVMAELQTIARKHNKQELISMSIGYTLWNGKGKVFDLIAWSFLLGY